MDAKDPNLIGEVFNQRGAIITFFGLLGGMVRSAALKTTWKEGLRVMFIGGATGFGVGVLAPVVLKPWIGDLPAGMETTIGGISAVAFLIGLIAVTIIERFLSQGGKK